MVLSDPSEAAVPWQASDSSLYRLAAAEDNLPYHNSGGGRGRTMKSCPGGRREHSWAISCQRGCGSYKDIPRNECPWPFTAFQSLTAVASCTKKRGWKVQGFELGTPEPLPRGVLPQEDQKAHDLEQPGFT